MSRPTYHSLCIVIATLAMSACVLDAPVFAADDTSIDVPASATSETPFRSTVIPFLKQHCQDCHSGDDAEGGIAFDRFRDSGQVQQHYELWENVIRLVSQHQMPPADAPQPPTAELEPFIAAINAELATLDCNAEQHPGRVTIRRLNKAEYNNTIRDLVGLDLHLANDFPSDDVGHGFDNIGDVLSIPPVLLEKYVAAAETIADRVFADDAAKHRVLIHTAESDAQRVEVARRNVREFAARAFRRPLTDEEDVRLFEIMKSAWMQGSSEMEIFRTVVTAVLASPHFLFRVETDPGHDGGQGVRHLNDYELASRLSYFLWSSMPDAELFARADDGTLHNPDVLTAQATRMLRDPRSRALVDNFAGQWLQLRDVSRWTPDPVLFPGFDNDLRESMRRETELFFETIIAENRSILDFLTADFTFMNERLAQHYGVAAVTGPEFQRVSLDDRRRGVLTHAGILMLTSNPNRTSPVKRGKWILENMLAEPPPPPPANVPDLEESSETLGSLREQMEQHRANEACAVCHRTMDALGFGLEHFDAIGQWRDRDGGFDVDASATLPGGRTFHGAAQLMEILAEEKKTEFCRSLSRRMLTYALGRGLTSWDRCTINEMVQSLESGEYRFGVLIASIVTSPPFTMTQTKD